MQTIPALRQLSSRQHILAALAGLLACTAVLGSVVTAFVATSQPQPLACNVELPPVTIVGKRLTAPAPVAVVELPPVTIVAKRPLPAVQQARAETRAAGDEAGKL